MECLEKISHVAFQIAVKFVLLEASCLYLPKKFLTAFLQSIFLEKIKRTYSAIKRKL